MKSLVLAALVGLAWVVLSPSTARSSAIFVPLPSDFSDRTIIGSKKNLQFSLLKGSKNTIIAWGPINVGDDKRLRFALIEGKPVQEIQLFSPGGSLYAGLSMGRIIRSERLSTRIVADAMCASACNFAFMGGVIRVVEPGGRFGVHMFSNDSAERLMDDIYRPPKSLDEFNDRYPAIRKKHYQVEELVKTVNEDPKRAGSEPLTIERYLEHPVVKKEVIGTRISEIQMRAAQTSADIAAFLLEMRLPLRFLTTFAHVRAEEIAYLSQQQLRALNIID